MNKQQLQRRRMYFTALVILYVWGLLAWQYFHGGVPSHHILHRGDLPSISNWWGGLLLPTLTWFLAGRINQREAGKYSKGVILGFFGALLYGIALSASFVYGLEQVGSYMAPGLLFLALFLPIYKSEYFLGFVLGMSYTFGALLPTGFSVIVALIAVVIYNYVRPIPMYLVHKLKNADKA